jgi:uncharacterized protein YbdZ (MbtH family)
MSWQDPDREDTTIYNVVINHEEQYSIWPAHKEEPLGWHAVGKSGTKAECLDYIKEVWTDMRPLSLRRQMEEEERSRAQSPPPPPPSDEDLDQSREYNVVEYLCEGDHPVEVSLRPETSVPAFQERIDLGYVHIKFIDTRGGTELGVRLDRTATDLSRADFQAQTGTVHLEGDLTLDYVNVRCFADINLETLTGRGHLTRRDVDEEA